MRDSCLGSWVVLGLTSAAFGQVDYSQYVNPFMGGSGPLDGLAGKLFFQTYLPFQAPSNKPSSEGGGDIFVGGAVPFGVVKVGIDTYEQNVAGSTINGGWTPKGYVTAISMMHESGTGGEPKYGFVSQMPLVSVDIPVNILDNQTYWQPRVGNDTAQVGYYKTQLQNNVTVELSGSRHAAIMQYSFPEGEKHVLVDVSHYLPQEQGAYSSQVFLGGEINTNGTQYAGYGTYGGGFNEGAPFTVYFCGEFDNAPDESRLFRGRNTDPMQRYHSFSNEPYGQAVFSSNDTNTFSSGPLNDRIGAVFSWDAGAAAQIKSRVGISFISATKACTFKDDEIPSWDLNETTAAAVKEWNQGVFSLIQVPLDDSANRTNLVLLYSSLYFMHLMPSDRTGENPLWDSGEPSWGK
jgi:putative alpha-1,2-mannosidase